MWTCGSNQRFAHDNLLQKKRPKKGTSAFGD
jgi:hypothetical protein